MDEFFEECAIYAETQWCKLIMLDRILMIMWTLNSDGKCIKLNVPKDIIDRFYSVN